MAQRNYIQPGPQDDSLLTQQARHRSQAIWDALIDGDEPLRCQRDGSTLHEARLDEQAGLDQRIEPYLQAWGFYGIWKMEFWQIDWHLITALVERWRPETHTFHMPQGECTITLKDIAILTGLPVDGYAVTGPTNWNWADLCHNLLGQRPPPSQLRGSLLKIKWLKGRFGQIPNDANEDTILQYARAFALRLVGGSIFADKTGSKVNLIFLPLLHDLDHPTQYSWGSAALAWLYRALCSATDKDTRQISGPLHVLQIWAWDRFSHIAPCIENCNPLPDGPLGSRWSRALQITRVPTHTLRLLRYAFDRTESEDIIWEPYTDDILQNLPDYCLQGAHIWMARVPLICFHIVEWHYPDRVLRQFGMQQPIPSPPHNHVDFHNTALKPIHKDWVEWHINLINIWNNRLDHIVECHPATEPLHYHSEYMEWFRTHTRRWISCTGGAVAGACDAVEQIIRLSSTISRENVRAIRQIAMAMLHAFNQEKRMTMTAPSQTATMNSPNESDEDDPPETVRSTWRTARTPPVHDPVSYPFTYHQGSDFAFTPANTMSSYGSEFFPHLSTPGYVPLEHGMFSDFDEANPSQPCFLPQDMPSSSTHPTHVEPSRRYNTRPAERRRRPGCGTGGHVGGRHHH